MYWHIWSICLSNTLVGTSGQVLRIAGTQYAFTSRDDLLKCKLHMSMREEREVIANYCMADQKRMVRIVFNYRKAMLTQIATHYAGYNF